MSTSFSQPASSQIDEVHSFVRIQIFDDQEKICYIEDLNEDVKGSKIVKVRYFLPAEEIKKRFPDLSYKSQEIILMPLAHEIPAAFINGEAVVLNPADFSKCQELLPQTPVLDAFVCEREFNDDTLHPFDPSSFRGYDSQPILERLRHYEEVSNKASEPEQPQPQIIHNIEVLAQRDGTPCCWYRCKALKSTRKVVEVLHYDVRDFDGEYLKESVPIEAAGKDKLGLRHKGRLTVRPILLTYNPPVWFELGRPVDVWQRNGWWEGVTTGAELENGKMKIQVYLPGENRFVKVGTGIDDIRLSKEWSDGQWHSLEANPNIGFLISSILKKPSKKRLQQEPGGSPAERPGRSNR